jgi:hypothetical protein
MSPIRRLLGHSPLTAAALALLLPAVGSAGEGIQFGGDARVRYEGNFENPGRDDHSRGRARFRFQVKTLVDEWVTVGARLRTGNPDTPSSPYNDFTENLDSWAINLDRAWIGLSLGDGGVLQIGRFAHVAKSALIWDGDLQGQGAALVYELKGDGALALIRPAFFTYLAHNPRVGDANTISGGELRVGFRFGDLSVTPRFGATIVKHPESLAADSSGNRIEVDPSSGEPVGFESDFELFGGGLEVSTQLGEVKLGLDGELVRNAGADDENQALRAGLSLAHGSGAGAVKVSYHLAKAQRDAVVEALSPDDSPVRVAYDPLHTIEASVGLGDHAALSSDLHLVKAEGDADQVQTRFRLNLDVRF